MMDITNISSWSKKTLKSFLRSKNIKKDGCGLKSLIYAAKGNNFNTVKILLENGAVENTNNIGGYGPLHESVINNNIKLVILLLAYNFSIYEKDFTEKSPLDYCLINDYVECFKVIMNNDNILKNKSMLNISELITLSIKYNSYNILSYLLSLNVIKNILIDDINMAIIYNHNKCLTILLENMIKKNLYLEILLLTIAKEYNNIEAIKILMNYEFNIYKDFVKKILENDIQFSEFIITKHLYYKLTLNNKTNISNDFDKIIDSNEYMKVIKNKCMKELNILEKYTKNKNKYNKSIYILKITNGKVLSEIFPKYQSYVYNFINESKEYLNSIYIVSEKLYNTIGYLDYNSWFLVSLYLNNTDINNIIESIN
ncbi:ankyrin repeat protein [Cotia virus SPAn232]|uniref:Ankyrin repeat protein n=2 Tax=Cotia virus TaxID=39444 RepID=H6TAI4_9POXV|nr:ankyrin repeat protein [Cotia virus SPAn232]AFB76921.1 ankyrin repeat protein [Cotia virus SPAn232]AIT70646.1 ankyrin repeat protein [Cotia virus]